MTKTVIHFDHAALKAACRIMAKDDIRYYLNGVYVEATDDQTILVATDGHRMLILRCSVANELPGATTLIIPGHIAKRIVVDSIRSIPTLPLTRVEADKWTVPLLKWGADISFRSQEGLFPNWRKVVPSLATNVTANLSPKYVADFQAAACDMYASLKGAPSAIDVRQNGQGTSIVLPTLTDDSFLGLVMPMVEDAKPRNAPPAWALSDMPKAIAAQYAKRTLAAKQPDTAPAEAQA